MLSFYKKYKARKLVDEQFRLYNKIRHSAKQTETTLALAELQIIEANLDMLRMANYQIRCQYPELTRLDMITPGVVIPVSEALSKLIHVTEVQKFNPPTLKSNKRIHQLAYLATQGKLRQLIHEVHSYDSTIAVTSYILTLYTELKQNPPQYNVYLANTEDELKFLRQFAYRHKRDIYISNHYLYTSI